MPVAVTVLLTPAFGVSNVFEPPAAHVTLPLSRASTPDSEHDVIVAFALPSYVLPAAVTDALIVFGLTI